MKVSVFVLSAISLAKTGFSIAVNTPDLDQATAAAPCALPFRMLAQAFEPDTPQDQPDYKAGVQAADFSFDFNGGSLPDNIINITDKYLFQLSIEEFEAQRELRQPPALDWYSDGCTKAPDIFPISRWNFLPACHRHDFGLQNYRKQGRLNKTSTRAIDDQFHKDLLHKCAAHFWTKRPCKKMANKYYNCVLCWHGDKDAKCFGFGPCR